MLNCIFVSDLHGSVSRYESLFQVIRDEVPAAVFLGGDLLPGGPVLAQSFDPSRQDFVNDFLAVSFHQLRNRLGENYPNVFLILGNDDPRFEEPAFIDIATTGLWRYMHNRCATLSGRPVYGYACVPPTPFRLKDWERYDVSRFTDPGCIAPEDGAFTVPFRDSEIRYGTIRKDLEQLASDDDLANAIMLFHSPPYDTTLDRAALDGKMVDHVPVDVHVGSIAIRRFIKSRQPCISLHGHVHESSRLTGAWRDRIGKTHCFNAAHDGNELAIIRFDPHSPAHATRELR